MSLLDQMKDIAGEEGANKATQKRDKEYLLRRIVSSTYPIDPHELLGLRNFQTPRIVPKEEVGTPVQEFFRDSTIFITGGTGFLGQILIEKLLRCCPHIKKIYVIIREKMNKSPADRFETVLQDRLFDRLRHEVPNFRSKLDYMSGSTDQPFFGLSEEDRGKISNDVNIIYHCAGVVKFNDMLAKAVKVNTMGIREMIKIARQVKNLKAFVYVSTAYSFCNHIEIEEKLYPMHIEPETMIELVEKTSAAELEKEVAAYIKDWPNTYVFSKALAEWLLQKEASDLPVAIHRPSAVISTYREPLRGWLNNLYGPLGPLLGFGLGLVHIHDGNVDDETVDLVPVDMVVNSLICATKEVALNHQTKSNMNEAVPIYNFASAGQNSITYRFLLHVLQATFITWAPCATIWYPSIIPMPFKTLYLVLDILLHKIPALIIDSITVLTKRKLGLTKIYQKLDQVYDMMNYFRIRKWLFKVDNVQHLWKNLSSEDKEIFYFDIKEIDWVEYYQCYTLGIRVFMMKDDIGTLPGARKKLRRLYFLHQFTKMIFFGLLLFCIYTIFK